MLATALVASVADPWSARSGQSFDGRMVSLSVDGAFLIWRYRSVGCSKIPRDFRAVGITTHKQATSRPPHRSTGTMFDLFEIGAGSTTCMIDSDFRRPDGELWL
jgi:hypothetical protein